MRQSLQFAVIRFMPFIETQEFANVGVIGFSPKTGFVDYRLAPTRFKRVTDFFDDLEGALYRKAMVVIELELEYIKAQAANLRGQELVDLMREVTRLREGLLRFSDIGVQLTDSPEEALDHLFGNYVGRKFTESKEYRERQMASALRKNITQHLKLHYREDNVSNGFGVFKLPLVSERNQLVKAIKPLAFDQKSPLLLADHGDRWVSRVKHLINAGTIDKENFMFTYEHPKCKGTDFHKAFELVLSGMNDLGVQIAEFRQKNKILDFASFEPLDPSEFELTAC